MSQNIRVRFAPSPTGPLHIGGVRTALFNYLFAKKYNGVFVLRIEDTDQSRYVDGAEEYIIDSLNWLEIPFDEGPGKEGGYGPYRQSERKHLYKEYADKLVATGNAYYAFDTSEELNFHRKDHEAKGKTFIYNWHNRTKLKNSLSISESETRDKLSANEHYVIRFKSPQDKIIRLKDIIRGDIEIDTNVLDDKVLFKSDGMPTYHLANIVDDHLMNISHVIRGEEWLPSMALHVLLYQAFGWNAPEFAHLPLIMKPVGKGKLSKRDGDKMGFPVFPLEWKTKDGDVFSGYREDGYLPEAVLNMLALLGWNPGTEQELFRIDELVSLFDLERVHRSGAKFDPEKTKWFQHHYLQEVDDSVLVSAFIPIIHKNLENLLEDRGDIERITSLYAKNNYGLLTRIVMLLKERATFVDDLWDQSDFFFVAPSGFGEKATKKAFKEDTEIILNAVAEMIADIELFSAGNLSKIVKEWITTGEMGFGRVMMPLRLALVGEMKGPDVFEIASLLGKEETIGRINFAIKFISQK